MIFVYRIVLIYNFHIDSTPRQNLEYGRVHTPKSLEYANIVSCIAPLARLEDHAPFTFGPVTCGRTGVCRSVANELLPRKVKFSALSHFGSYFVSGDLMTSKSGRECSAVGQCLRPRVYKSAHPAPALLCLDSPINQSTLYIGISFTSNFYRDNSPTTPIATHGFRRHRQTPSDVDESSPT
jgi:hypothetical protein